MEWYSIPFLVLIVGLLIALFLVLCFIFPLCLTTLSIAIKSRRDYRSSRGYQHLKQIKKSLKNLNRRIRGLESVKRSINSDLNNVRRDRYLQLQNALINHVVNTRITEVPGIGQKLSERIIGGCFDGTLQSLHRAGKLHGIGPEKAWDVSSWADSINHQLPKLLEEDFPGKCKIIERFSKKESDLIHELDKVNKSIMDRKELRNRAVRELHRLEKVKPKTFRSVFYKKKEARDAVHKFILGTYAEWESMPDWYRKLISEYG